MFRNDNIRWKFVFYRVLDFYMGLMFLSYVIDTYLETLGNFCVDKLSWKDLVLLLLKNAPSGILITFTFFYIFLHCWMNAFAEVLKFGDRLFYKVRLWYSLFKNISSLRCFQDWWTSSSYPLFFRTWNLVVHDWLYTYILKDCYEYVWPKNKLFARSMVFLLSAMFHEYILSLTIRSFLPILFVQFFFMSFIFWMFNQKNGTLGNLFTLYTIGFGLTLQIYFYTMETLARENCPLEENTLYNILVPRLLRCDCFLWVLFLE